jgi:C-terminal processing protease CtpA/Prc
MRAIRPLILALLRGCLDLPLSAAGFVRRTRPAFVSQRPPVGPVLQSVTLLLLSGFFFTLQGQQPVSSADLDRGRVMLRTIKEDLKNNYYDPAYHGMDLDARFKTADQKIKEATSLGQIFGIIAQTLIELKDSHTFFIPPGRTYTVEYGWQMQIVGEKCLVVAVKPGSDAEAKGLQVGDQIYSIDGVGPVRENFWIVQYTYRILRPKAGVSLIVIKPDGKAYKMDVSAKVQQRKLVMDLTTIADVASLIRESQNEDRLHRHRYIEMEGDVFIWKMPQFDMPRTQVDSFVEKFRKSKGLVLDLRGNQGGYEETLLRLISNVFDHDVKLGDLKTRKGEKPMTAKTRGKEIFTGKLVVLIDSESGSASELFARVVQLEKRGTVIGDRSAGAVMRSKSYDHQLGVEVIVPYSVSITDADIVMTDGKSLEHVGVIPDEARLPTPADLAAKRDPVLAYALSLLGSKTSAEAAGLMFPIEWKK